MKKKGHNSWYTNNKKYSVFLDNQDWPTFTKFTSKIAENAGKDGNILDIGCGTGVALAQLHNLGIAKKRLRGIEISKTSIEKCRKRGLRCSHYEGQKLPFSSNLFRITASINVLEHTENPIFFLNEMYRVTKKGGSIVLVTPNFLSVTNNYHVHTRGLLQKFRNIFGLLKRGYCKKSSFEMMEPIENKDFLPDDDAIVVTNPVDILHWAHSKKLTITYWSSQQRRSSLDIIDMGPMKLILGSCFFVFKK